MFEKILNAGILITLDQHVCYGE